MIIPVNKFGEILISRPAGREHALIMRSSFRPATKEEPVELDFVGVRVRCAPSTNASLVQSLKTLEAL